MDALQAETAVWCLGAPLVPFSRAPVTLGAIELPPSPPAATASGTPPSVDHSVDASNHRVFLLPVWRPKRLASFAHGGGASFLSSLSLSRPPVAASSSSSSSSSFSAPTIYNGVGSRAFLSVARERLRMQFDAAMAAAALEAGGGVFGGAKGGGGGGGGARDGSREGIGDESSWFMRGASAEDEASFLYGQADETLQAAGPPVSRIVAPGAVASSFLPPALVDMARSLRRQRLWKHFARARGMDIFTADSRTFEHGGEGSKSPSGTTARREEER